VSPVKYELGFYIPEDAILHSHCRDDLISYILATTLSITNHVHIRVQFCRSKELFRNSTRYHFLTLSRCYKIILSS
jgi:hypothetical protein